MVAGGGGGGAGGSGGTPPVSGVVAEWSDSDYGGYSLHNNPAEHLYAHIPDLVNSDHLYHTLDQTPQTSVGNMLEVREFNLNKVAPTSIRKLP